MTFFHISSSQLVRKIWNTKWHFTAHNSSCGNVMFLQVSVCPQGDCVSQHALHRSHGQQATHPLDTHTKHPTPWTHTPLDAHTAPPGRRPRADTPPPGYYGIRSTSGWYASFWNEYLFHFEFGKTLTKTTLKPASRVCYPRLSSTKH